MRHTPGNAQPFTALTMLHQSMELFEKTPEELAQACRFTPAAVNQATAYAPAGRRPAAWLEAQITATGTLVRHPPRGHARYPGARFYVHAGPVFCPAAWDKQHRHPLHLLAVQRTRLPLTRRMLSWLRARLALRPPPPPRRPQP